MNYIGSKQRLSKFLKASIMEIVDSDMSQLIFCDLFAGTGAVGKTFKPLVRKVISNDVEYYSYVLNRNYIGNHIFFDTSEYLDYLNDLEGVKGFIFEEYSDRGSGGRLYFSAENGKKIDAVRQQIEKWKNKNEISEDMYYFLLASLIESADKIANTASVYGAFLKKLKKGALKPLVIEPAIFDATENNHQVFCEDSNKLIKKIEGDILYLDPPYNIRQYGSNYHLLNTIAQYDRFLPKGITGVRDYYRSPYCKRKIVKKSLYELIKNANFKYLFLSYNNEGLMTENEVSSIMSAFGKYDLKTRSYHRFKADKTENRNHKATSTVEYLCILEKQKNNTYEFSKGI